MAHVLGQYHTRNSMSLNCVGATSLFLDMSAPLQGIALHGYLMLSVLSAVQLALYSDDSALSAETMPRSWKRGFWRRAAG